MLPISHFESKKASEQSMRLRKKIYGFGINDAPFVTQIQINGKKFLHPSYDCWRQLIRRCYSDESLKRKPHYRGVSVCESWASFNSFHSWWIDNHVDGWQIDKDILTDEKIYSPWTCIFIPNWLNAFLTDARMARGKYLIGVTFNKMGGVFEAYCNRLSSGKQEYLGGFKNEVDAHLAWKERKLSNAHEAMDDMNEIDPRLYPRVIELINRMR